MPDLLCGWGRYVLDFQHGRDCFACRRAARMNHEQYAWLVSMLNIDPATGRGRPERKYTSIRLTPAAVKLLRLVVAESPNRAAAAKAMGVKRQYLDSSVRGLVSRGLLYHPDDSGKAPLLATPEGVQHVRHLEGVKPQNPVVRVSDMLVGEQQLAILRAIQALTPSGKVTWRGISRHLGLGAKSFSTQAKRLTEKGLVASTPGQVGSVRLTPLGVQVVQEANDDRRTA